MAENPYPCRKMGRFWRWHMMIFVLVSFMSFALAIGRGSSWYAAIPLAVGWLLMLHLRHFVHCPTCSRRLRARIVQERGKPDLLHFLYDCPSCQITWDSQYVQGAPTD